MASDLKFRDLLVTGRVSELMSVRKAFIDLDNWHIMLAVIECQIHDKPCSERALSRATGITRGSIGRHIDTLLERQLLERRGNGLVVSPASERLIFSALQQYVLQFAESVPPNSGPEQTASSR